MSAAIPTDEHGHSPFRAAVESQDFNRIEATLAEDVVFRSPVVFSPYQGRQTVGALLRVVGEVIAPALSYQWQVREGDREVLSFLTQVSERSVEGVDLLRYDARGQVAELVVMMRPASALAAVRDAVGVRLQALAGGH